jgi:hypothetical protein
VEDKIMKTWSNAEMKELRIEETAQGGSDFTRIDDSYIDSKDGLAYSTYDTADSDKVDSLS